MHASVHIRHDVESPFNPAGMTAAWRLNDAMDAVGGAHAANETQLVAWLREIEKLKGGEPPAYWLLLMRLNELTLLCAGNYADCCELCAAGDLLVNPREVRVAVGHRRQTVRKWRHGRMTAQFGPAGRPMQDAVRWLKTETDIADTTPALLPGLFQLLENSGRVAPAYLAHCRRRMERIADTIAFLTSWQIFDAEALCRRITAAVNGSRAFIETHLCRFDNRLFVELGGTIRRQLADSEFQSEWLRRAGGQG